MGTDPHAAVQTRHGIRSLSDRRLAHGRLQKPSDGEREPDAASPAVGTFLVSKPAFETARRIAEFIIIAAASSAGLYLVGTVYTDAYHGRLSIEVTSLDLAPPYVALQSVHAL